MAAKLGRVQFRIMTVLWEKGQASARDITDALNAGGKKSAAIAHSTVQTLLRQMEDKGAVSHRQEDRTFVFYPVLDQNSATRSATRDLIERVFAGSASGLVAYLLKEERIKPEEMREIRKLIDNKSPNEGGRRHDAR